MAFDSDALVVASAGAVYAAPVGTTAPSSSTTSLNAAWVQLGYVTEDGVSLSVEPSIEEFTSWNSRNPIRRELVSQSITVSFALQQFSGDNVILAFGGGEITTSGSQYTYSFGDESQALEEKALLVEWADGDRNWRAHFARGTVTDTVETTLSRTDLSVLPITFSVLEAPDGGAPGFIVSDDPAFGVDGNEPGAPA